MLPPFKGENAVTPAITIWRHDGVIVALFTAYLGVLLTHAMVHLEPRQIAGVMAFHFC